MTQRHFTRINLITKVFIKTPHGSFSTSSRNISVRGIFIRTNESLSLGDRAEIDIVIPSASFSAFLNLKGVVTRVERGGVAFDFEKMDPETFSRLRNVFQRRTAHRLKPFMGF